MKLWVLLIATALAACLTKPVPGVCCIGAEDCAHLGLSEDRPCLQGQACVDFHCVEDSCTTLGCPVSAPVCDLTAEIATCRGCRLDSECPSGACGDDGACIDEASIVYLHPAGADVGACQRDAPCQRLDFGAMRTSATRDHIVMAAGLYDLDGEPVFITAQSISTPHLFIHGGGGVVSTGGELAISMEMRSTIRDLEINSPSKGLILATSEPSILERVKVRGPLASFGVQTGSEVLMRDIFIEGGGDAIRLGGRLTIDRGVIRNPRVGIVAASGSFVDLSNLLISGATEAAFDLTNSSGGTVSFTTIADSGTDSGTGPRAFRCPLAGPLTVRSSIIWAPGSVARPAIDTSCTLMSTIVGPTPVPGAANVDPRFEDSAQGNYRLSAGSPARDATDDGPATDFEGDPRPQGARFDLGADEGP